MASSASASTAAARKASCEGRSPASRRSAFSTRTGAGPSPTRTAPPLPIVPLAVERDEAADRRDGEVAVAPREFLEGVAVARGPGAQFDAVSNSPGASEWVMMPLTQSAILIAAFAAARGLQHAVMQRHHVDELRRRVEMAERAAEGAAVAGLAMADMLERLVDDRKGALHVGREFEIALPRHGPEAAGTVRDGDIGQRLDPVEIDQMVGRHHAEIEHRHQRLPARERQGVVEPAEQIGRLIEVVGSW